MKTENTQPMAPNQAPMSASSDAPPDTDPLQGRRTVLKILAATGIGTAMFRRALANQVTQGGGVTAEMIGQAEWVAGLELTESEREETAKALQRAQQGFQSLRDIPMENSLPPALHFHVTSPPGASLGQIDGPVDPVEWSAPPRPDSGEDLAFLPVTELAALVRARTVSSEELTRLYLDRLHQYDKLLHCVVTFTDDLALKQARRADAEIAAGRYRGPLHGIPWGAKDLIAYPPFKTTWGAPQFKDQVIRQKATVAERLDAAGAVLVAKLSLGALAWGDKWFGGMTRNPWDPSQGSSGSSAGSAAATAAGLVGFALGSETLGSIVSPCRRCGVTGLRPTFGRVSRHGCMTLAWSMDKIGPLARSVEDCALVFSAIHGSDGQDTTAVDSPFSWPRRQTLANMRVGYFEETAGDGTRPELDVLRDLGVQLVKIELPTVPPARPVAVILNTEAATAFDDLLRHDNLEGLNLWPGAWREAQFVPAVEYLRANRARTLLMRAMDKLFEQVDVYVGGRDLVITNLTGHPTVVLPNGFRKRGEKEVPTALTFTGKLFGETNLLALAQAYQQATGFHLRHPPMTTDAPAPEPAANE